MSVTLVNNSPQLTVATAGTRGLTGAHVVNASFSGSNLIITLSDGTVINAGGTILSSSGSNNWVGQQAINGNVIVTGSFILSGSNTLVNIGPASFSGSVNVSGSTTITGSLIVSGGTINVIGTNLISASQGVTLANTTGYSTFSSSISQSLSHSVANLSSSIGSLSGSVTATINSKFGSIVVTPFLSKSNYESYTSSIVEPRLASLEAASGSIRLAHNAHTSSVNNTTASLNLVTASLNTKTGSIENRLTSLETKSGSVTTDLLALFVSTSIDDGRINSLEAATQSLFVSTSNHESRVDLIEALTGSILSITASLSAFTSSADSRLDSIEAASASWGASTNISSLNTFSASVNTFSSSVNTATASLNTFTASANTSITALNIRTGSMLESVSLLQNSASAVLTRINQLENTSASINSFTESVNSTIVSLNTITSSLVSSVSLLATSASDAKSRINALEVSSGSHNSFSASVNSTTASLNTYTSSVNTATESLNAYTESLKSGIDVTGGITTILGNLVVQGTQISINTTNLKVADKLIEIASGSTTPAMADGAGIYISGADARIDWNNNLSKIAINKGVSITGDIAVSGLVDGVELSQLSGSFNTISSSLLAASSSFATSIDTINSVNNSQNTYSASVSNSLNSIHTTTASLNTFTGSTYLPFSTSVDSRILSLSSSLGGGATGTRISALETSASLSAVTNSNQSSAITGLLSQVGNLLGGASGTTNQLNALNASASANVATHSVVSASILSLQGQDNVFRNFTSSIETWIGQTGTFATASASFDNRIASISAEIGGGSGIGTRVAQLENTASVVPGISASLVSQSVRIEALETFDVYVDTKINQFSSSVSSSNNFITNTFPAISQSFESRISQSLAAIANLDSGYATDGELVALSSSAATSIGILYTSGSSLSSSIWNPSNGISASIATTTAFLSSSINDKIQHTSASITTRINGIVIGTGFVQSSYTTSLHITTASLFTSASALASSASTALTTNNLQSASINNLSAYTSSLQLALQPNSNNINVSGNLFVSGNIVAQQYIVSSSQVYITTSFSSGSNVFGDDYGDEHSFSGSIKLFGPLVMREGFLGASGNQTAFIDISGSITSSGQLKVNGITSSFISASTFVSASNFYGEYNGVSTQVHLSQSIGYNSLTASISGAINAASNSLSASITTTTNTLSGSVDVLFTSASSLRISASANRNNIIFLYTSASSLETSASLLSTITSASIASGSANQQSGSANKQSGSVLFTSASSLQLSASALQTSASAMITSASNLSSYTHSLQQSISVTGSNLRVLGNANIQNDLIVSGNIIAQQYIVSSSVSIITTSFSSGSTIFGDTTNDTHKFTGSVYITNDITASNIRGTIIANNAVVSSSEQFVQYGALLTSSFSLTNITGRQAVSGTLIVSGTTSLTGSTNIDLRGVPSGNFTVQNGATRIDSILFVSDNDYVSNAYVGGDIRVADYLAGGYTAHYDGGVQITGSLRVNAGQNGSGSYFTGSVWITGNEVVSGNLQVVGNTSVSGNFIGTTISASSAVTASSLRVEGLTRVNGDVDLDSTKITIGAGGNADADETRLNTLNLRVDSDAFFNSNITAISGSTRFKSVAINDLSESRIPYVDSTDTLTDNANFTYNGVVFKVGGGAFEVDNASGNIRTSGSLSVGGLNISNNLNVAGVVGLQSTLTVTGSTLISSSLRATSTASFGALTVTGSSVLGGRLQVGTNAAISGNLGVIGSVSLSSSLFVSGNITASANANISGDVAITGSLNAVGPTIAFGNSMTDNIYLSGNLEITGSLTRNTTNLKAAFSQISTYTQEQAWSASFVSESTLRTPDEYLEYFVGQGSNKRRYITPVWLDETLYADDYFDISTLSGQDSDYVY